MKLDDLVGTYIQLRDKKDAIKAQYDAKVAKVDEALGKIEAVLLQTFDEAGIDAATKHGVGTAYKSTRTSATVADRGSFLSWVGEDFDERQIFLEARCGKSAVDEYKNSHEGALPPGVNWKASVTVNIRRA